MDSQTKDLSAGIANDIRDAIVTGEIAVDQRLPSETELAEHFEVSRPTIREALKRLAAQSLIRTQRGAGGGAFVQRLTFEATMETHATTSALVLRMNDVPVKEALEARFAMERPCVLMAATRRTPPDVLRLQTAFWDQQDEGLTDAAFLAADTRFHRAVVDASANRFLSYQLAGVIEGISPLLALFAADEAARSNVVNCNQDIFDAIRDQNAGAALLGLDRLEAGLIETAASSGLASLST